MHLANGRLKKKINDMRRVKRIHMSQYDRGNDIVVAILK